MQRTEAAAPLLLTVDRLSRTRAMMHKPQVLKVEQYYTTTATSYKLPQGYPPVRSQLMAHGGKQTKPINTLD